MTKSSKASNLCRLPLMLIPTPRAREKLKLRSAQMLKPLLILSHRPLQTLKLAERCKLKVSQRLSGAEEDGEEDALSEESSGLSLDSGEDACFVAVDS